MLLLDFKKHFSEELQNGYPVEEVRSFFQIVCFHFLNISRLELALNPEIKISSQQHLDLESSLRKLKEYVPVQYITGETEFYGLTFKVNQNVLIPRPETEELVEWIISDHQTHTGLRILDIGTGSGCIAISLAKNLKNSVVTAIDFSEEAMKIARKNAKVNKIDINFIKIDILKTEALTSEYDIIVSNPPYVRELEKKEMNINVLDHEPASALYVSDNDPLIFYRKITQLARKNLSAKGQLYFEINQYLGKETQEIMKENGFSSELKKDIFGNDRMLKGKLNE